MRRGKISIKHKISKKIMAQNINLMTEELFLVRFVGHDIQKILGKN